MRKFAVLALILFLLPLAACREEAPAATAVPEASPAATEAAAEPTAAPEIIPTEAPPVATAIPEVEVAPPAADEAPIYLAIIWHQHQPVYFKDPETGLYAKPWVRVHATKDYVDMAAMLEGYPEVHATFNLTPSLLRQLEDFSGGARDVYWQLAEIPAEQLTDGEKQFILDRFFDTNRGIISRFPRYQQLLALRDGSADPMTAFSSQDFLDLQIWFNLAWVDPDWLAQEPLASLVAQGSDFQESDKAILFGEHLRLINQVIPIHRKLQDAGQIEVTMTPFAHPILPLLVNSTLALEALPGLPLPDRFSYLGDAEAQVSRGVELYEELFGQPPRGMWPAEGSVAEEMVDMVAANNIQWMASDEGVLANSLGFKAFDRGSDEVVLKPDLLYRPYYVQGESGDPVAILFRDVAISDKVGFTYSGMPGDAAAQDFVDRIHAIRETLAASGSEGPRLVSVILDGENAWEYYQNDGKAFLHGLYQRLSDDPLIKTVTPTEFLEIAPEQPPIGSLWAGSWINHDFATWIGEEEENRAWDALLRTRKFLGGFMAGARVAPSPEALEEAITLMYIAEGSDWFWWYGTDQDSGSDGDFDQQYRDTLRQIYLTLGEEPPRDLDVAIIPQQALQAQRAPSGLIAPEIDGLLSEGEWDQGGYYQAQGGAMASAATFFEGLGYGFDARTLYLSLSGTEAWAEAAAGSAVELYLALPGGEAGTDFSRSGSLLGFPATGLLQLKTSGGALEARLLAADGAGGWEAEGPLIELAAMQGNIIELAVPAALLGNLELGDQLTFRAFYAQAASTGGETLTVDADRLPLGGPGAIPVPELGNVSYLVEVDDPAGDDHGPGGYSYPQDGVFTSGSFDISKFQVGVDDNNVIFRFTVNGSVPNPWGSPNGLAIQTVDVYIDQDGSGTGGNQMLPGRNLAFQDGYGWEYAIHAEGWESGLYAPGEQAPEKVASGSEFSILTDDAQGRITIRVPKALLGDDPQNWRFAAVIMSQEGYPSAGVWRIRDVAVNAEQWRIGGAPQGATNHTRVMDLVWPEAGLQEEWLSAFTPVSTAQTKLTAADFATVPMLPAQE